MAVKIITVSTQLPEFSRKTEDIIPYIDFWLNGEDERFIRKAKKIFEGAMVDERYSIMSPEQVFSNMSFEDRNQLYSHAAIDLGQKVLEKALAQAQWIPKDLDFIITVSCTGIMIPSLDAFLINLLGLKQDIVRLPVTEMGCVGGISGLIYAKNFLKAHPNKKAAVITFESPTATFQWDDHSMANIVSAAIFGDGAACALLSSCVEDIGPEIVAESMYHFYNQEHMMGFKLVNSGLKMVLDVEVPETISDHFPHFIHPFLEENQCKIEDLNHLIFHPGGKKIVNTVEEIFLKLGKNIHYTKEVLRSYGNMSSATVLFVLKKTMEQEIKTGEKGLMLSFGPGFTAQRILLSW